MAWTFWLAALAPLAHLTVALTPGGAPVLLRASRLAAIVGVGAGFYALIHALVFGPATSPLIGVEGVGLSLRLDPLSGVMSALIGFIGWIVLGYSRNYLAGDPRQAEFLRGLCLTLGLVQGLVLAGDLVQLVLCWIGASLAVNRLLLFRGERQAAVLAARKRFLVARLAEICLIVAAGLLWRATGTSDIGQILAQASALPAPTLSLSALLLALAAILSSAQLPFHGWILEVMETPTPVSALLHAGVVNAGGFLMLRFADVLAAQPGALILLIVVGAATAIFGSLVMLTQTSVKVGLAYSTIAQMGFMLLECGLGAFSAALLHIVAHSLYKAHAFLSAGSAAAQAPAPRGRRQAPLWVGLLIPVAVGLSASLAAWMGEGAAKDPGALVLTGVLALGLARVLVAAWEGGSRAMMAGALITSVLAIAAYGLGQALFAQLLEGVVPSAPEPTLLAVAASIAAVTLMAGLVGLQLALPRDPSAPGWARAYAVIANGFYLNTLANRWALRFWPAPPKFAANDGSAQ
jgi:NAD(P)H-quinone oxidoreductase subunit 5